MQFNTIRYLTIALAVATVIGCGKAQEVPAEIPDIPAVQQKTALTADINTEIQNADTDFYTWLSDIGALGKDIEGKSRGATSWPGCYQN